MSAARDIIKMRQGGGTTGRVHNTNALVGLQRFQSRPKSAGITRRSMTPANPASSSGTLQSLAQNGTHSQTNGTANATSTSGTQQQQQSVNSRPATTQDRDRLARTVGTTSSWGSATSIRTRTGAQNTSSAKCSGPRLPSATSSRRLPPGSPAATPPATPTNTAKNSSTAPATPNQIKDKNNNPSAATAGEEASSSAPPTPRSLNRPRTGSIRVSPKPQPTSSSSGTGKQQPAQSAPAALNCAEMSLYDGFLYVSSERRWIVKQTLIDSVLSYVRAMHYDVPPPPENKAGTGSKLGSPVPAAPNGGRQAANLDCWQSEFADDTLSNAASPKTGSLAINSKWCSASPTNSSGGLNFRDANAGFNAATFPAAFLPLDEALRWLAEQEYVIGTVLLTCALADAVSPPLNRNRSDSVSTAGGGNSGMNKNNTLEGVDPMDRTASSVGSNGHSPPQNTTKRRGSVTVDPITSAAKTPANIHSAMANPEVHPVVYASNYVLNAFPQWGDGSNFRNMWEAQVQLVTEVACPERQKTVTVTDPNTATQVTFSSSMECGHLVKVAPVAINSGTTIYQLWAMADPKAEKKLWFRFSVKGWPANAPLCLRLMNLSPHEKLYLQNEMKPSWMPWPHQKQWRCVTDSKFTLTSEGSGQLSFFVVSPKPDQELHFAYCVPYGYSDLLCYISLWHASVRQRPSNVRFEERVLCRTWDQRKLHLLIISSQSDVCRWSADRQNPRSRGTIPPYTDFSSGKKVVLVSGRVHPGEVTASHSLHGIITFLLSCDPRAELLRDCFIFFIIPMLNPDGCARGHTRLDQKGNNLNNCYNLPADQTPPTVAAIKTVFHHLQTHFSHRFMLYMDFHSHVSKDKSFSFGNHLPASSQCWNLIFAKLIAVHAQDDFDYNTCHFGLEYMHQKEGSARVSFGESLTNSYTIELTPFTNGELDKADEFPCVLEGSAEVGRACVKALLDYCGLTNSEQMVEQGGWDAVYKEIKRITRNGGGKGSRRP